jgi:hypothetical protein
MLLLGDGAEDLALMRDVAARGLRVSVHRDHPFRSIVIACFGRS